MTPPLQGIVVRATFQIRNGRVVGKWRDPAFRKLMRDRRRKRRECVACGVDLRGDEKIYCTAHRKAQNGYAKKYVALNPDRKHTPSKAARIRDKHRIRTEYMQRKITSRCVERGCRGMQEGDTLKCLKHAADDRKYSKAYEKKQHWLERAEKSWWKFLAKAVAFVAIENLNANIPPELLASARVIFTNKSGNTGAVKRAEMEDKLRQSYAAKYQRP